MLSDIRKEHLIESIKKSRSEVKGVVISDIVSNIEGSDLTLKVEVTALDAITNKVFVSNTTLSEDLVEGFDEDEMVSLLWEMIDESVKSSRPK